MDKLGPLQVRWIAAMTRGLYQQSRHFLYDEFGYCCLGIACRVLDLPAIDFRSMCIWPGPCRMCAYFGSDGEIDCQKMPGLSWRRIGLRGAEGDHRDPDGDSLSHLNDDRGLSLREIAHVLERDPDAYFTVAV